MNNLDKITQMKVVLGYLYFPAPSPVLGTRPRPCSLAPAPTLFDGLGPYLYLAVPALDLYLPSPGPEFVFTRSG